MAPYQSRDEMHRKRTQKVVEKRNKMKNRRETGKASKIEKEKKEQEKVGKKGRKEREFTCSDDVAGISGRIEHGLSKHC
jgi:transposase